MESERDKEIKDEMRLSIHANIPSYAARSFFCFIS